MGKYYGIPMHMHSCWERNASMEGHMFQLQKLGLNHMYLTDHDVRMGRRRHHIDHFDFSQGKLYIDETPDRTRGHGFQEVTDGVFMTPEGEMCLSATSVSKDWSVEYATFDSSQKRHEVALLAKLVLHLGLKMTELNEDTRVVVDVELSMRPPEFQNGHILYVFGNCDGLEDEYHAVKPMKIDGERYSLNLLEDAENIGGGDNVLKTVTFSVACRNGKSAKLFVNHFSTTWELSFEEGRREQQKLADALGEKYGITPFVVSEISDAGRHKNCFSTQVPIIDYEKLGFDVTEEYAIRHVLSHAGVFAINHPFEEFKRLMREKPERKAECYQSVVKEYLENGGLGATLIEVGFPMGRSGFTFEDHLSLWDILTREGILLTAYGDSDTHGSKGFFEGNNFVGYIFAEEPGEDAFTRSMKAGNLYTGDPVYLQKMKISFHDGNHHPMGSVIETDKPIQAVLSMEGIPEEMTLVWNINGKNLEPKKVSGTYCGSVEIPAEGKMNFARAALYHGGRCIMMTNPIHATADKEQLDKIADVRRVAE